MVKMILNERYLDVVETLRPYKDNEDIYIHFSDIQKVGIYPSSNYKTPVGIYAYPLKEMWPKLVSDTIPFAGDRKYIQVIEDKSGLAVDISRYTTTSLEFDRERCLKILLKYKKSLTVAEYLIDGWISESKLDVPGSKFWNMTRELSIVIAEKSGSTPTVSWNVLLRKLDFEVFTDKTGTGIIHENEPIQAVFLIKAAIDLVETLPNVRKSRSQTVNIESLSEFYRSMTPKASNIWGDESNFKRINFYLNKEWRLLLTKETSEHFTLGDGFYTGKILYSYLYNFLTYLIKTPDSLADLILVFSLNRNLIHQIGLILDSLKVVAVHDKLVNFDKVMSVVLRPDIEQKLILLSKEAFSNFLQFVSLGMIRHLYTRTIPKTDLLTKIMSNETWIKISKILGHDEFTVFTKEFIDALEYGSGFTPELGRSRTPLGQIT